LSALGCQRSGLPRVTVGGAIGRRKVRVKLSFFAGGKTSDPHAFNLTFRLPDGQMGQLKHLPRLQHRLLFDQS